MLSNTQPCVGTSNYHRHPQPGGKEGAPPLAVAVAVSKAVPGPTAVTCETAIDGGGWEYIDLILSQLKKD